MLPPPTDWMPLRQLWEYIASCPWLWWLGMSETPQGLRRRATDGNILAKLAPVIIVPILTAFVTAYVTLEVLKREMEMYMKRTDERLHNIEQRLWDMRIPSVNNAPHMHMEGLSGERQR